MPKHSDKGFINQLLLCVTLLFFTGGSAGLGTVWLRHKISETAAGIQRQEQRMREIGRRLAEADAAIEEAQNPELLKQRNRELGLGLAPVTEEQVVRVGQDMELRLAAKRNASLFGDSVAMLRFSLESGTN